MHQRSQLITLIVVSVVFFAALLGATGVVSLSTLRGMVSGTTYSSYSSSSFSMVSSSLGTSSSSSSFTSTSSVGISSSDTIGKKGDICTKNIQCKPLACINGTCQ